MTKYNTGRCSETHEKEAVEAEHEGLAPGDASVLAGGRHRLLTHKVIEDELTKLNVGPSSLLIQWFMIL